MRKLFFVLFLLPVTALAAGGSGSPIDLLFPAINALLFFGFLGWKLKGPLKNHFETQAKEIEDFTSLAEKKNKEAQIKFEMFQEKVSNLNKEVGEIKSNNLKDIMKLKETINSETEDTIARLRRDAQNKIESEKNEMLRGLYSELVEEVVVKAKSDISSDSGKKDKAVGNLISKLQ
ncbi:MAG: hypothetical protein ACPGJV_08150 [Bacteriovoracaceae bacterium]